MSNRELQKIKSASYGDFFAHVFLWQRAIFMTPIWAIAVIPVVGFIFRSMGGTIMQLGFGAVLCAFSIYFLEDLLKRKISMDDQHIFFGFKTVPIRDITNVDVVYKKGKFLPASLLITCSSGKRLRFNLSGLTEEGVNTIVKHLQARNSNLKTAPVLNTLVKCRTVKRKPLENGDQLELPYQSRKFIQESIEVFRSSAAKWARIGPVVTCILCGPVWMNWLAVLYVCLQPHNIGMPSALHLNKFMTDVFESLLRNIGNGVGKVFEVGQAVAANSFVTLFTAAILLVFFGYLATLLWRPNLLLANSKGLKLVIRLGDLMIPLNSLEWDQIAKADLYKKGSGEPRMRLSLQNGKSFDISLAAIAPEERVLLLRKMEKFVPTNQIDPLLSQAMLPKADRSYTEIWLQSLNQPPERKTLDPLSPGQLVGDNRFEVIKSIGVGGQGKAYLCKQLDASAEQSETVVLKETIIPIFADSSIRRKALESFDKEAQLLKSLKCDGVVDLLDYFVEDHRAYLVLEHVDGSNLRDLVLTHGALPEEQVQDLAIQMCEILKALHANGVVHRDFTPDNLILNSRGKLKLIDFNVAQQIREGSSGTIVGKHAYLPPEQFRGKASTQSDLYAFGATLYFLLTGCDPEPISQSAPSSKNAGTSKLMNDIVKRATCLQTNNRYACAEEIEADLLASDSIDSGSATISLAQTEKEEIASHG